MRVFGYSHREPINEEGLLEMDEISFAADTEAIRAVAEFLLRAASEMESAGPTFDHVHMQDMSGKWRKGWTDLVVSREAE